MGTWSIIVIVVSAVLLALLCRQETRRPDRARLAWRLVASVIAVVCLACLALNIRYRPTTAYRANEILVATEGAEKDSILLFQKNKKKDARILNKEDLFSDETGNYDTIHVFGYGLTNDELLLLKGRHIVFHPHPVRTGIVSADWNMHLNKGEVLAVQGTYVNETGLPVLLLLKGFDTVLDSVTIAAHQTKTFLLRTVPKQNGKAVFSMAALEGKDTLETEPLPVHVEARGGVKVLILAASPDFENKFLKDWLAQNGYGVVTKTNISTNKFDRSAFNMANAQPDRITNSLLDSFDVLVSDEASLNVLPAAEREAVFRQVSNKGMGLIIKGDTVASAREWYTRAFHLFSPAGKQPDHVSLSFRGNVKTSLPVEQPRFLRIQNGMQALVKDSASNAVAAVVTEGSGKIVFTTLDNTYSWLLSGNVVSYHALWNLLLEKAARPNSLPGSFAVAPSLPVVQNPITIKLQTQNESQPVMKIGNRQPSLAQDIVDPNSWQTGWWPLQAGWQPPLLYSDLVYEWYVYEKNDWRFMRGTERIKTTENFVAQQQNTRQTLEKQEGKEEKPVSLFWFFLPFIICSGFLWLERKIS